MHWFKRAASLTFVAFAVVTSGCVGAEKSANPLSPTVAGPIPGVGITSPNLVQPLSTRIPDNQQPVTLMVSNSATTGVRPLTYTFEIASDAAFNNKVFTRDGVAPGDSGQTSLRLPDALATGHTYYWRAKAQDGANSSDYSFVGQFDVYTPIVIQAPTLVSPVGNVTTDTATPRFTIGNAPHSGPVGPIVYVIEVADSDSFSNKVAVWTVPEQSTTTSLDAPGGLPYSSQLFWRVRAADPANIGPYSSTAVFKTPAAPAPPAGGGGSGSGGGGGGGGNYASLDQINLGAAHIAGGGPSDVASWTVSTNIQSIEFNASAGLYFNFPASSYWPDYTPPGWSGPLQYTVWACAPVNGWTCAGFIQMWRNRGYTGAPLPSNYIYWWGNQGGVTSGVFGGYVPHAGDTMAFFVTAGNERADTQTLTKERSNVVLVTLPAGDSGFFSF